MSMTGPGMGRKPKEAQSESSLRPTDDASSQWQNSEVYFSYMLSITFFSVYEISLAPAFF